MDFSNFIANIFLHLATKVLVIDVVICLVIVVLPLFLSNRLLCYPVMIIVSFLLLIMIANNDKSFIPVTDNNYYFIPVAYNGYCLFSFTNALVLNFI